jgi:hypothetical protein
VNKVYQANKESKEIKVKKVILVIKEIRETKVKKEILDNLPIIFDCL